MTFSRSFEPFILSITYRYTHCLNKSNIFMNPSKLRSRLWSQEPCSFPLSFFRKYSDILVFLQIWNGNPTVMLPRVDGEFLPDHPAVLLREGKYNKVDLISGITKHEGEIATLSMIFYYLFIYLSFFLVLLLVLLLLFFLLMFLSLLFLLLILLSPCWLLLIFSC